MSLFYGINGTLFAFVLLQPQQVLEQEVLSINQHRVTGANATAVAQYARRSLIVVSDGGQIPVDQRLHDALPLFSIALCACAVGGNQGKTEQPSRDDCGCRRVPVPKMNAFVVQVV